MSLCKEKPSLTCFPILPFSSLTCIPWPFSFFLTCFCLFLLELLLNWSNKASVRGINVATGHPPGIPIFTWTEFIACLSNLMTVSAFQETCQQLFVYADKLCMFVGYALSIILGHLLRKVFSEFNRGKLPQKPLKSCFWAVATYKMRIFSKSSNCPILNFCGVNGLMLIQNIGLTDYPGHLSFVGSLVACCETVLTDEAGRYYYY